MLTVRHNQIPVRLAVWLMVLMVGETSAFPQASAGGVSGRASDAGGGAVRDALVTIENQSTGEVRSLQTYDKGFYSFPNLAPVQYKAPVSRAGFGNVTKKNLVVAVGQQLLVDFDLNVGVVESSVGVSARPQEIALTSSTSTNVSEQSIRDLPLNGCDWTLLAALEPGVHAVDSQVAITTGSNRREDRGWGTEMAFGGSRPQQNNYRLDGISMNDFTGNGPGNVLGSVLDTDAIQEFSVVTAIPSADYGKTSGGVINALTRAGSNDFRGSTYEFLRNSDLDARNFFDGSQIPAFRRNHFGATVGGPIRSNRSFFFFNYEGLRQDLGSTTVTTVPSASARTGQLVSGKVTVEPKVAPVLLKFAFSGDEAQWIRRLKR